MKYTFFRWIFFCEKVDNHNLWHKCQFFLWIVLDNPNQKAQPPVNNLPCKTFLPPSISFYNPILSSSFFAVPQYLNIHSVLIHNYIWWKWRNRFPLIICWWKVRAGRKVLITWNKLIFFFRLLCIISWFWLIFLFRCCWSYRICALCVYLYMCTSSISAISICRKLSATLARFNSQRKKNHKIFLLCTLTYLSIVMEVYFSRYEHYFHCIIVMVELVNEKEKNVLRLHRTLLKWWKYIFLSFVILVN